jgi:hypothetical protein
MNVTETLRAAQTHRPGSIRSLPFDGERFDVVSVRELRKRALAQAPPPATQPPQPAAVRAGQTRHDVEEPTSPATAGTRSTPSHDPTPRDGQSQGEAPSPRLRDQVWAWVVAAATIASLIGLAIATLL